MNDPDDIYGRLIAAYIATPEGRAILRGAARDSARFLSTKGVARRLDLTSRDGSPNVRAARAFIKKHRIPADPIGGSLRYDVERIDAAVVASRPKLEILRRTA